ncbi:MAG: hypothetical protein NC184_07175 [Roseburia sp.]|nr:hypothetical protein [Roseburia sp.]
MNGLQEKAYVAYTFIDEQTSKELGDSSYTLAPNFRVTRPTRRNLVELALKRFFDVETQDEDLLKSTSGCVAGVHFCAFVIERAVGVAVSREPIGAAGQVPFDIYEPEEYASRYFNAAEVGECRRSGFADETTYIMLAKKKAFKYKHSERTFGDITTIDTTEQAVYTLHKDRCDGRDYYFVATDTAEFVKIDIKSVKPKLSAPPR